MRGGIFVAERNDRFRLRAQEFINRARWESDPLERRLWLDLALECLRLAADASKTKDTSGSLRSTPPGVGGSEPVAFVRRWPMPSKEVVRTPRSYIPIVHFWTENSKY
jgi:hypothetical protein